VRGVTAVGRGSETFGGEGADIFRAGFADAAGAAADPGVADVAFADFDAFGVGAEGDDLCSGFLGVNRWMSVTSSIRLLASDGLVTHHERELKPGGADFELGAAA
jgi:hypothetical protein